MANVRPIVGADCRCDRTIVTMSGTRTFFIYNTPPLGPETTGTEFAHYGAAEVKDTESF